MAAQPGNKNTVAQLKNIKVAVGCVDHPDALVRTDYSSGDMVCDQCGRIVADRVVDVGSEWRTFASDGGKEQKDMTRVGAAETKDSGKQDFRIRVGNMKGQMGMSEMQRANMSGGSHGAERSMQKAKKQIELMGNRINLGPNIITRAQQLFAQTIENGWARGTKHDTVGAATLMIACRDKKVERSYKEICAACKEEKKMVGRAVKLIAKGLRAAGLETIHTGPQKQREDPYVGRFCSKLRLSIKMKKLCSHVSMVANGMGVVAGRQPTSTSAAAIYMSVLAMGESCTPEQIHVATGVTTVTIREAYRDMYVAKDYLFANTEQHGMTPAGLMRVKNWGDSKKVGLMEMVLSWANKNKVKPMVVKMEPKAEPGAVKPDPGAPQPPGQMGGFVKVEPAGAPTATGAVKRKREEEPEDAAGVKREPNLA